MPVQNIDLASITAIDYNGTSLTQVIYDGFEIWPQMLYSVSGQALYDVAGTYSWVCPVGVTSVCVVCIGGGGGGLYHSNSANTPYQIQGGGGGSLAWSNNINVTEGTSYTVEVGTAGQSGPYTSGSTNGSPSWFFSAGTIRANGGYAGRYNQVTQGGSFTVNNGAFNVSGLTWGGGQGGFVPKITTSTQLGSGGGGGAGGYSGSGGWGGHSSPPYATSGSGGGGAGGGKQNLNFSYGGGGVGPYGEGASGVAQQFGKGRGGSGGGSGYTSVSTRMFYNGGNFGGGGGGSSGSTIRAGDGGGGCVRIIWGTNRAFPSTNTTDV